jgi:hypothetical protein
MSPDTYADLKKDTGLSHKPCRYQEAGDRFSAHTLSFTPRWSKTSEIWEEKKLRVGGERKKGKEIMRKINLLAQALQHLLNASRADFN